MKDLIDLLGEPDTTVTVVGASDNPSKYSNVIYRDLRRKEFTGGTRAKRRTSQWPGRIFDTMRHMALAIRHG